MSRRLTYEEVQKRIEQRGCKLLSKEYYRNSDKLDILCSKGHTFKMKLNDFSNGHNCPHCAGLARHSYNYIKTQIEKEGFMLVSTEYRNAKQKLQMICPKGHECEINWNNFSNGFRCKKCGESKGEREISKCLNKLNIEYKQQHTFKDCKNVFELPFDFYLPSLNICIEYDGEQHFFPTRFGNMTQEKTLEEFEKVQIRDKIKTDYCKERNIKLIRIPYIELNNIESIIENTIKEQSQL